MKNRFFTTEKNALQFAFALSAAVLLTSAPTSAENAFAQKKNEKNAAPARTRIVKTEVLPKKETPATRDESDKLFDQKFETAFLKIGFMAKSTDEIEYSQIYSPFKTDFARFKTAFSEAVRVSNTEYAAFLRKARTDFSKDAAFAVKKIKENRDPARVESLKSMLGIMRKDQSAAIGHERDKIKNRFNTLFGSYLNSYSIQKKFMAKNTVYEPETSEINLSLKKFEGIIESRRADVDKFIDARFSSLEVELLDRNK